MTSGWSGVVKKVEIEVNMPYSISFDRKFYTECENDIETYQKQFFKQVHLRSKGLECVRGGKFGESTI